MTHEHEAERLDTLCPGACDVVSYHGYGQFTASASNGSSVTFRAGDMDELVEAIAGFNEELLDTGGHVNGIEATPLDLVYFPVGGAPMQVTIPDRLKCFYDLLGCNLIQTCYSQPTDREDIYLDVVCNDEGKFDGSKPNRAVYFDDEGRFRVPADDVSDVLAPDELLFGDFCVVAADVTTGEFTSVAEHDVRAIESFFPVMALSTGPGRIGLMFDDDFQSVARQEERQVSRGGR